VEKNFEYRRYQMLVQVTLENSNGAKYCVDGKLVSKTETSITLSHSGYVHRVVRTYRDKIVKLEEISTAKGLARRVLDDIKSNVQA
jgi:hypothetical protein